MYGPTFYHDFIRILYRIFYNCFKLHYISKAERKQMKKNKVNITHEEKIRKELEKHVKAIKKIVKANPRMFSLCYDNAYRRDYFAVYIP